MYWALYLACYAAGGWEPAWAGWQALRERTLDVDLLMIVAAIGAAAIGQVFDGALLIVIFATSGALEAFATQRTADAVRGCRTLAPERATRLDDGGGERQVAAADLAVGDRVRVRPGERIRADGRVVAGASEVDQATITGEPLPADKTAGDEVFAGTLNGTGALTVEVTRAAARQRRGPDRGHGRGGVGDQGPHPAVHREGRAALLGRRRRRHAGDLRRPAARRGRPASALLRAMTFMIVASPCAVVLATMPPLLSAIANASRHGVLVKSAVVMERLGTARWWPWTRPGRSPTGHRPSSPSVPLPGAVRRGRRAGPGRVGRDLSEHPIGKAIVAGPGSGAGSRSRPTTSAPRSARRDGDSRRAEGDRRLAGLRRLHRHAGDRRHAWTASRRRGAPPSSRVDGARRCRGAGRPDPAARPRRPSGDRRGHRP